MNVLFALLLKNAHYEYSSIEKLEIFYSVKWNFLTCTFLEEKTKNVDCFCQTRLWLKMGKNLWIYIARWSPFSNDLTWYNWWWWPLTMNYTYFIFHETMSVQNFLTYGFVNWIPFFHDLINHEWNDDDGIPWSVL